MDVKELVKLENEELIKRYRETGDDIWANALFIKNEYYPKFIAHKYFGKNNTAIDFEEREELAQIGMVKALKYYKLDAGVAFSTYAAHCMATEIYDHYRKVKRWLKVENPYQSIYEVAPGVDPSENETALIDITADERSEHAFETLLDNLYAQRILEALSYILSPAEHTAVIMHIEGHTQTEIGEVIHNAQGYVTRVLHRAYNKIRAYLEKIEADPSCDIARESRLKAALTPTQYKVYQIIQKEPDLPRVEIARRLGKTNPHDHTYVSRLIRDIETRLSDFDSRSPQVG